MGWDTYYDRFTVTLCQSPAYCDECDELIGRGQVKVSFSGNVFHKKCAEQRFRQPPIRVDLQNWKVRPHE